MEIITIPLKGALAHKDSTGKEEVIGANDVQVMSAGTGLTHSEYNHSENNLVNSLQIWVLPKEKNIVPRYDQKTFPGEERQNNWQVLVSPNKNTGSLWINQDAYLNRATVSQSTEIFYEINSKNNGVYLFLIDGNIKVAGEVLKPRDAIGIYGVEKISIKTSVESDILIIEVPMN